MFSLKKTLLLVSLISSLCLTNVRVYRVSASEPKLVYYRMLPLYDQMTLRLEKYNKTLDWEWKVHPNDIPYLNSTNDVLNVQVYVLNPKEAVVHSRNRGETQIQTTFYVYQALDEQVKKLSQFSPTYLYKSKFTPVICMETEKDMLSEIASFPFVYCIRVIPKPRTMAVAIDEARAYNDLIQALAFHDNTIDPMDIAIIGTGYEYPENDWSTVWPAHLNGEAEDNIEYTWDFFNNDSDVSDAHNAHCTDCLDLLARAFGDTGDDDEMYDDPNIYSVLKCGHATFVPINYPPWVERREEWRNEQDAIEWCIEHDMEVVSMSFGHEPVVWIIPREIWLAEYVCNGWWCDLFKLGVEAGVTWVAAAGNFGADWGVCYPAESHYVIAVGSYASVNETTGEAYRSDFSNYGRSFYLLLDHKCDPCWTGSGLTSEFKPNVYDAGQVQGVGWGTSYATSLAAASIALGIYSQPSEPTDQAWIPGYETVHDTIALCNEWAVMPSECSQQGDVTDTHTLWHRSVTDDNYELTVRTYELGGGEITNVDVWIDSTQYSSPVENLVVACGDHTVEVESPFYQDGYKYVFQYWEDGNTSNPRTVNIVNDMTLRAYYKKGPILTVRVPQAPPEGVKVWVDGDEYWAYADAPVSVIVEVGEHTIEVQESFLKEEEPWTYYIYTFDHWSDGSTDNPRTDNLTADTTLIAYYLRSKYGIMPKHGIPQE